MHMDIRASLAQLPDDQVIGPKELAAMLNTTTAYIYKVNSCAPDRLPRRLNGFGSKLVWRMGTCRQWLRQQG